MKIKIKSTQTIWREKIQPLSSQESIVATGKTKNDSQINRRQDLRATNPVTNNWPKTIKADVWIR